ncbi:hypothetical protein [Streptomyces sp. C36]|uniref:hypothetical protein n=1 Tax=Streptomyces sp. C36 TaxID=3237122 RepID=UPI0034C60625
MPDRRFTAATAVLTGLLVLGPATTAHAHGDTIRLTVTGVTAGHPVTTATWEDDGHPVREKVAGTLTATSADGTTLGPWRFVQVPDKPGTFTTAEALPAGRWTVTAQTAFPALGHGEAETEVTAASLTAATGASAGPPAPSRAPSSAPPADGGAASASGSEDGPGFGAVAFGVAALALAALGTSLAFRLRRRGRRNA